ncbi:MAG: DUF115 domain-containing protein [bacterium]|nr:DUF115 domain-containing protein [bacterium]
MYYLLKPIAPLIKKLLPKIYLEEPGRIFGYDKKKLKGLKDKYKGERCFIIGNGPSLNLIDTSKLNDEYAFGVNAFFYKTRETGYKPYFYCVEDTDVMKDNLEEINKFDTKYKFFPSIYKKYITNRKNTYFFNMNRSFYEPRSKKFEVPSFSKDCSQRVFCGQSVTIINLQLAYYLGFSEVYLVGMDFSYVIPDSAIVKGKDIESTEDDPNHFHPEYFGKGKKWHDPKLHNVLKSYINCREVYEADGRKIYNSTVGGKLEVFERKEFNSLFDQ